MLKLEKNMIERIIKGKASIEFQLEAYEVLGESLAKIEEEIKKGNKIIVNTKTIEETLNKEIKEKPIVTESEEVRAETKKELNVEKAKKEIKEEAKKQINKNNKMISCGENKGTDEIVYIEKVKNDIHTWRGQIRLENVIYNFNWSNELSLPIIYNAPDLSYILVANDMIKERVGIDECNKYDQLFTNVPELGNYGGRYYYDEIENGSFIYMTPWFRIKTEEPEVWFKGYTMDHAFVVFSDKRIYYRNVNYLFAKRPWEKTVSKGYDTKEVRRSACRLMKLIIEQFENYVNNNDKNKNKEMEGGDATITKTEPKLNVNDNKTDVVGGSKIDNIVDSQIHSNNDDVEYINKNKRISIEDIDAGKRYVEDVSSQKDVLNNMDVSAFF